MRNRFKVLKRIRQWLVVDTQKEFEDLVCSTREEARQKARELNIRPTSTPTTDTATRVQ